MTTALPSTTVNIENAPYFILRTLQAGLVPYLVGQPGGGKSSIFAKVAKDANLELIDIRLSTLESVDGNGYPVVDDGSLAYYKPFDLVPLESFHTVPKDKDGWLVLLDELPQAEPEVIKAFHKLILDRKIGSHNVHPNVVIAAAGNLVKHNAYARKLETSMQSRLVTYELSVDSNLWVEKVAIPMKMDNRVIAYVLAYPSSLTGFNPHHTEHTFACPRTMHMLSDLISGHEVVAEDKPIYVGAVGEEHGTKFLQFCLVYSSLPSKDEILSNPSSFIIPDSPDKRYALVTLLSEWVDSDNLETLINVALRLPAQFYVLFGLLVNMRNPGLISHPAMSELQLHIGNARLGI